MSAFKGTLSALDACRTIAVALAMKGIGFEELPAGDGGKGTLVGLYKAKGGREFKIKSRDPMGEPVEADVLQFRDRSLFVECASVCSLPADRRNAMKSTTRGLGELLILIRRCFSDPVLRVTIGIGDTSTSDGGSGMLQALGYQMPGSYGDGASLANIRSITPPTENLISGMELTAWCDVKNPLVGPLGSARTFAPQKGASPEEVEKLEAGMENWGKLLGVGDKPHGGSGGGLGSAFLGPLGAKVVPGAQAFLEAIEFSTLITLHSHVFTGEGKTDAQTLQGKLVGEIVSQLKAGPAKAVVFSGQIDDAGQKLLHDAHVTGFSVGQTPSAEAALRHAVENYIVNLNRN